MPKTKKLVEVVRQATDRKVRAKQRANSISAKKEKQRASKRAEMLAKNMITELPKKIMLCANRGESILELSEINIYEWGYSPDSNKYELEDLFGLAAMVRDWCLKQGFKVSIQYTDDEPEKSYAQLVVMWH